MKLSLVPSLMIICSDLLLQNPLRMTAFPLSPPTQPERPGLIVSARRPSSIIFHPSTGLCVLRKSLNDPLNLGDCNQSDTWVYTPEEFLEVKGTYFCLQAVDSGKPARLGIICTKPDSSWEVRSNSKSHLSTKLADGTSVCLDVDPRNILITNPCVCLDSIGVCESDSQWFEITAPPLSRDQDSGRTLQPISSSAKLP